MLLYILLYFHLRLFSLAAWVRLLFCNSHLRFDVFENETAGPLLSFICHNRLLSPILCLLRVFQASTEMWSITQHIESAINDRISVILPEFAMRSFDVLRKATWKKFTHCYYILQIHINVVRQSRYCKTCPREIRAFYRTERSRLTRLPGVKSNISTDTAYTVCIPCSKLSAYNRVALRCSPTHENFKGKLREI